MALIPAAQNRALAASSPAYPAAIPSAAAGAPPLPLDPSLEAERNNPLRLFSLGLTLVVIFLRVSGLHQAQTYLLHVNLKLLYVTGIPAVLGTVLCGGLQRSFRGKPAFFWTAFALWMFVTVPFAHWPGGALMMTVLPYLRTNLIMVFMVAGLVIEWKECQSLMRSMAWGALGTLLLARIFQNPVFQERFGLEFGTVSNPNDFACHLLLVLPFLYWVVLTSKWFAVRLFCLAGIAYGSYLIVGTASRGALIGICVVALFFLLWGSMMQRLALIVLAPIAIMVLLTTVSHTALNRIVSFSASSENASQEALESSESRRYLLRKSIEYAVKFPIFGVGPGMFAYYEGSHNTIIGSHGSWHGTHNTFTQVASETGFPGLIFFVGGLMSSLAIFYSIFRKASRRPNCVDIRNASMCVLLGMIGFIVSSTFLNFAYFFYQPLLGGMAVAFLIATKEEFAKRDRAAQGITPVVLSPIGPRRAPMAVQLPESS